LLAALAGDDGRRLVEIDVPDIESQKFSGTQSTGVEQFDHGAIAEPLGCDDPDTPQELADLCMGQRTLGQETRCLDAFQCRGQRRGHQPAHGQVVKKPAGVDDVYVEGLRLHCQ